MASLREKGAMTLRLDVTSDDATILGVMQEVVNAYGGSITHVVNAAGYLLEGVIEGAS